MRKIVAFLLAAMLSLCLTGCSASADAGYTQIDQDAAKTMMAADDGHVVVDVRRQDE